MGFFDEFADTGGLDFVSKEEKDVLITERVAFPALRVYSGESKFGERYMLITVLPDQDEERTLAFGKGTVESRDRMLDALSVYLEREDAEPPLVYLEKKGNSILIRDADGNIE